MAHILITGAAGFIGSHTAEVLLATGHRVTGVDNFRTGRRENLSYFGHEVGWSLHEADVCEPAFARCVEQARPDAVIHLAGLVSVQESISKPALNFELNVRATQVVLDLVRQQGIPRLVIASSAAVYGDNAQLPLREESSKTPLSPYGGAKLAGEALSLSAARTGMFTAVCLRYFNVFGPRQQADSPYSGVISKFVDVCRKGEPPVVFGDGNQTRDFIHVRDVALANMLAATHPAFTSGAYNVGSGCETSLIAILNTLRELSPTMPPPEFRPARCGDILRSVCDPSLLGNICGFSPRVALRSGLEELLQSKLGGPEISARECLTAPTSAGH